MSFYSKIRGTIETLFQLGLSGPQLKANAGVVEARNSADAAFAIVRGDTPVAANDLTTKAYVDAAAASDTVQAIRFAISNSASQSSATSIPANAYILSADVEVTTPYSGGATITVGRTGSATLLQGTTDNNPQANGAYDVPQDTTWGGSALPVLVTIAGAPAAGVGVVLVTFSVPAV